MSDETIHLRSLVLDQLGDMPVPNDLSGWAEKLGMLLGHWFERAISTEYNLDQDMADLYFAVAFCDNDEIQIMLNKIGAAKVNIERIELSPAVQLIRLHDQLYNQMVVVNSLDALLNALDSVETFTNRYFPGRLGEVAMAVIYGVEQLCRNQEIEPDDMFALADKERKLVSQAADKPERSADVIPIDRGRKRPK